MNLNAADGIPVAASALTSNQLATRAILYAWLTAGTCDILAACAYSIANGKTAAGVLRAVASGLIGERATGGGLDVQLLGLALHFGIMLVIVTIYWLASRRLPFLIDHAAICGLLFGVAVYAVMNLVVLPLSAIAFTPSYSWKPLIAGIVTHMLCVGLPIALIVRNFSEKAAVIR